MERTTYRTLPVNAAPLLYHAVADAGVETDLQLIVRVQQHNPAALEVLYDRYAAKGMGLAFNLLQDSSLAEEVTLEAFWWVWRFAFQFPSTGSSFADWFFGFVRQLADKELPRRETRLPLDGFSGAPGILPNEV